MEFESTHNEGLSFAPLPDWRCFAKQNSIVSLSAKHMIPPAYPYRDSNPENLVPETSMYSVPSYGRTPRGIRTLKTCVLSAVRIPFRHGCINKPFSTLYPRRDSNSHRCGLKPHASSICATGAYVINRFVSRNRNSISFVLHHFLSTMRVPIPHLLLGKQIYFRYTNGAKSFSSGSNRDYYCLQVQVAYV